MAQTYNITIDAGSTYTLPIRATDAFGAPLNLTAYTLRAEAKSAYTAASASFSFTVTKTDATAGEFALSLTAAQTAAIAAGVYVYDAIQVVGGDITRLIEGTATVTPGVTD